MDTLLLLPTGYLLTVIPTEWNVMVLEIEDSRSPLGQEACIVFAEEIGEHGRELLTALFDPLAPKWLLHVPIINIVQEMRVQNDQRIDDAVRW